MKIEKSEKFTRLEFPKDTVILNQGDLGDAAYVIAEGKVEIRVDQFGKSPQTLATRTRGDVIGDMALFDDKPWRGRVDGWAPNTINR